MDKDEEIVRWMVSKIDRIDAKLDRLLESYWTFYGKMIGVSVVVSFLATAAVEYWRSK
jgi:hypothetical protein